MIGIGSNEYGWDEAEIRWQQEEVSLSVPGVKVSLSRWKRSMRFDFGHGVADLVR
jgi:hypothetical protein